MNVWGGKLGTQLIRLVDGLKPDIACLQEATDITSRPGSVLEPYSTYLPSDIYQHTYFAPGFSYRYMHGIYGLGNAIISKTPFATTNSFFTMGEFKADIDSAEAPDYNNRNIVHVIINVNGTPCNVLTHHGHHSADSKDGGPENTEQNQKIADYISTLEGPIILTGDFNVHPESESLAPLHAILTNLPVKYGVESTRTQLAKRQEVIDYIFVSEDVIVENFEAREELVSDHKALLLDFTV